MYSPLPVEKQFPQEILNKPQHVKVAIHSLNYAIIHLKQLFCKFRSISPKWPKCVKFYLGTKNKNIAKRGLSSFQSSHLILYLINLEMSPCKTFCPQT